MEYREKVLAIIQMRGPTQPLTIAKELLTNSTLAGAMLSEMTDKGQLKASHIKVGSGPLYYIPGQEEQLLRYTYALNEKDKKTVELLQQKKVLRENTQEPLTRVGLKTLKDFAVPLEVYHNNTKEIFWRWFSITDLDAEQLIKQELGVLTTPLETALPKLKKERKRTSQTILAQPKSEISLPTLELSQKNTTPASFVTQPAILPFSSNTLIEKDEFMKNIQTYFVANNINVIQSTLIKKQKECEFIIELPSVVGTLSYYCYALNKKKILEADISHVFVKAQLNKLPSIILSPGELTKPAQAYLEQLRIITFKQVPHGS